MSKKELIKPEIKKITITVVVLIIVNFIYSRIQGPLESYLAVGQLEDSILLYSFYRGVANGDIHTYINLPLFCLAGWYAGKAFKKLKS